MRSAATAGSRNVDASETSRQSTGRNDVERRRRRRRRHHSVNDAISRIDVRVPLRLGQDAARPVQDAASLGQDGARLGQDTSRPVQDTARPVQDAARPVHASVAEPPASDGGPAVEKPQPPLPPVADEDRASADQPDRDRRPSPLPDEAAPRTAAAARGSAFVGVDVRPLGRRCRSLDNIHALADHRTYALLMIAN